MGNFFGEGAECKAAIFSGIGAFAIIAYIAYEAREKRMFRQKLIDTMSKQKSSFEDQINQVYLKDHVRHYNIRN